MNEKQFNSGNSMAKQEAGDLMHLACRLQESDLNIGAAQNGLSSGKQCLQITGVHGSCTN